MSFAQTGTVTLPVGVTTLTGQWRLGKRVRFVGSKEKGDGGPALLRHVTGSFPQCPTEWLDLDCKLWKHSRHGWVLKGYRSIQCSRVLDHSGVHI